MEGLPCRRIESITMSFMFSSSNPASAVQGLLCRALVIFTLLVCLNPAGAQSQGYTDAFNAYQNQKFGEAESIWLGLARDKDVNAQYALGVMHLRGEARKSSPALAFSWFEKAADQGHATAMFNLGVAYWEGSGVNMDRRRALELWEESANKGDSGAQFNLGLAYYIGEEREHDLDLAAQWVGKAAEQNHPEAKRILKAIDAELEAQRAESPMPITTGDPLLANGSDNSATQTADSAAATSAYWRSVERTTSLYDRPGGTVFREIPPGTPLNVLSQDGDWTWVAPPEGLRTWVYAKFIDVSGESGTIQASSVRVRPQPSADNSTSPPLGVYPTGARVKVLRAKGEWVEIRAPESIGAWIKTDDIIQYRDTAENRASDWARAKSAGV